jgi:hypothetical protein
MRSFCQLAFLALPLCSTVLAASPTRIDDLPKTIYASAHEAFQDILNALPEESLQAALSGLKDFKSGVFESHHRGVEHVHSSDPALATKLIVDAVNDLRKRQTPSNGTTTVTENNTPTPQTSQDAPPSSQDTPQSTQDAPQSTQDAPPPVVSTVTQPGTTIVETAPAETSNQQAASTQPAETTTAPGETTTAPAQTQTVVDGTTIAVPTTVTTTAQRPAIIPVQETVTQDGSTVVRTTRVLSQVTASVAVTIVRTNPGGNTVTQTEQRPAVIKTTTDSAGRTTITTSAANYAPTAGEVQTEINEQGSTFLTTYTPGGGLVSSIKLITTTDAEGRPSTMTSYTFVDPIQATQTAGGNDGGKTGNPSVQTAAAAVHGVQYAVVGLGALAFFV